jgi:hypothetical protein
MLSILSWRPAAVVAALLTTRVGQSRRRRQGSGLRRARCVAVVSISLAGLGYLAPAALAGPSCSESNGVETCVFSYTGGNQKFDFPAGVMSAQLSAIGAGGGQSTWPQGDIGAPGGEGSAVGRSLSSGLGDTFYIYVGGAGSSGGSGGWNGGAEGHNSLNGAAGGGGASDIRDGGTSLSDRILIAGGAGGAGGGGQGLSYFGGGWGGNGGSGGDPGVGQYGSVDGGGAGTSSGGAGGAGQGSVSSGTGGSGSAGSGGSGGGHAGAIYDGGGGGGGGGGWYGGGGGGAGGTSVSVSYSGGGGGGGSSYGYTSGPSATSAAASVTISYDVPSTLTQCGPLDPRCRADTSCGIGNPTHCNPVWFAKRSARLNARARRALTGLARIIRRRAPSNAVVQVDGFPDDLRHSARDGALARRRARAVGNYLRARLGARYRYVVRGHGKTTARHTRRVEVRYDKQVSCVTDPYACRNLVDVQKQGSGAGTVTSNPAAINCGSTCTYNFGAINQAILTAAPAAGSTFQGWSGGSNCSGTGTCTVIFNLHQTPVTATFSRP